MTSSNLFLFFLLVSVFAFACSPEVKSDEPIVEAQQITKQEKDVKPCDSEPLYGLVPNDPTKKNMKAAWEQFVSNGRYRIACDSDSDFALDAVEPKTIESYSRKRQNRSATSWGALNYPMREYDDHLIVIVVDTARTDAERFGVVILSPSATKKVGYDVNWLYQNRDLSRASVGRASGSAYVGDYTADGKRVFCWIKWNKSQKKFICRDDSALQKAT